MKLNSKNYSSPCWHELLCFSFSTRFSYIYKNRAFRESSITFCGSV